jgi:hypothetical protein
MAAAHAKSLADLFRFSANHPRAYMIDPDDGVEKLHPG